MKSNKSSLFNYIAASIILLMNIPLLYLTVKTIITGGGPWGYGLIGLPLMFIGHLFLIPAYKGIKNLNKSKLNLFVNGFGSIYCLWLGYIYLTSL